MAHINFIFENIPASQFDKRIFRNQVKKILAVIEQQEKFDSGVVNLKLCDDDTILAFNKEYLLNDYFTDIITFVYDEDDAKESDILISTDTVLKNSLTYKTSFEIELARVVIHGFLHLAGYDDKTASMKKKMTIRENHYLKFLTKSKSKIFYNETL